MADQGLGLAILFSVGGTGEATLGNIAKEMQNIATQAVATSQAMTNGKGSQPGLGAAIDTSGASMVALEQAAMAADTAFRGITSIGSTLIDFGASVIGAFAGVTSTMLDQMGEVETSLVRIMSLGNMSRQAAMDTAEHTLDLAMALPGSIRDMTSLTANLMEAGVDMSKVYGTYQSISDRSHTINKEVLEMTKNLGKESQRQVTVGSGVVDMAASFGETGARFKMFQHLMTGFLSSGNAQRIKNRISIQAREAITEAATAGGKWDTTKATEGMMAWLEKTGKLGTGMLMSASWEGIKEKFGDMPTFFARMVGGMPGTGGPYDQMVKQIFAVQTEILTAFEDPKFQASVKGALAPIFKVMVGVLHEVAEGIKGVFAFVKEHPELVKFAVSFMAVAAVVAIVAGAFLVAVGTIGSFVAAITLLLAVAGPGILMVFPAVIALAVALAVALGAGAAAIAAYQADFGGIKQFFGDLSVLIQGTIELFQNMGIAGADTSAISEESFVALNERGLMPFFRNIEMWIPRVMAFWEELKGKLSYGWNYGFGESLSQSFTKVSEAVKRVIFAVSLIIDAINGVPAASGTTLGKAEEDASSLADKILWVANTIAEAADRFSNWIHTMVGTTPNAMNQIMSLAVILLTVKNVVELIGDAFVMFGSIALIALSPVVGMIAMLASGLSSFTVTMGQVLAGDWEGAAKTQANANMQRDGMAAMAFTAKLGVAGLQAGASSYETDAADLAGIRTKQRLVGQASDERKAWGTPDPQNFFPGAYIDQSYPAIWNTPVNPGGVPLGPQQSAPSLGWDNGTTYAPGAVTNPTLPADFLKSRADSEATGRTEELFAKVAGMVSQGKAGPGQNQQKIQIIVQSILDGRQIAEAVAEHQEELSVGFNNGPAI